jgi:hypothetical protein
MGEAGKGTQCRHPVASKRFSRKGEKQEGTKGEKGESGMPKILYLPWIEGAAGGATPGVVQRDRIWLPEKGSFTCVSRKTWSADSLLT